MRRGRAFISCSRERGRLDLRRVLHHGLITRGAQDISYDLVVAVMDRVRVTEQIAEGDGRLVRADLFPEISIGDAPVPN